MTWSAGSVKHKLKIYSIVGHSGVHRLWYTDCQGCDWQVTVPYNHDNGKTLWGRPSFDLALAVGLAHLRQECKHG